MREEFDEVDAEFATPRLSELAAAADGIEDEDLIEREDMVVTVTMDGYIKRTPLSVFREQKRGGKGRAGMATKDEDAVTNLFVTSTHNPVLFFSNLGRVYRMKVWRCPKAARTPRAGRWSICSRWPRARPFRPCCRCPRTRPNGAACTSCSRPPTAPSAATAWPHSPTSRPPARSRCASARRRRRCRDDDDSEEQGDPTDRLIGVELLTEGDDVLLATRNGKAIRFKATDVREFQSRTSTGVRGVRLLGDDQVISMSILHRVGTSQEEREAYLRFAAVEGREGRRMPALAPIASPSLPEKEQFILTVTENGYGKRSSAYEYRRTNRGGQGITNIDTSERNGCVVASFPAARASS